MQFNDRYDTCVKDSAILLLIDFDEQYGLGMVLSVKGVGDVNLTYALRNLMENDKKIAREIMDECKGRKIL